MIQNLLQVALGGAVGALARYGVTLGTLRLAGPGFPWATMLVNVLGSFLMGGLVVALATAGGTRFAPFLLTGLLGGFTTFSAFSLDVATLYTRGEAGLALAYAAGSVGLSLTAIFAGMALARGVLA